MIALHDAVQDGGVADPGMPVFDWQLAGDDGCLVTGAVVDDLQQVGPGHAVECSHAPVIQDQHIGPGQLEQPFAEGAAAVPDTQFFLQAGYALVKRRLAAPAGILGEGTCNPGLAGACRPSYQDAVAGTGPVPQCQAHYLATVDAAARAGIDILDRRLTIFQAGVPQQARELAIVAAVDFPIHHQRDALLKAQCSHTELGQLLFQSQSQAVQFQYAQLRQSRMHHHLRILIASSRGRAGEHGRD